MELLRRHRLPIGGALLAVCALASFFVLWRFHAFKREIGALMASAAPAVHCAALGCALWAAAGSYDRFYSDISHTYQRTPPPRPPPPHARTRPRSVARGAGPRRMVVSTHRGGHVPRAPDRGGAKARPAVARSAQAVATAAAQEKTAAMNLFDALGVLYPCKRCRRHFHAMLVRRAGSHARSVRHACAAAATVPPQCRIAALPQVPHAACALLAQAQRSVFHRTCAVNGCAMCTTRSIVG